MKTPNWKPQLLTTIDGIEYNLHFEGEHLDAKKHFVEECDWTEEVYREVSNYYWFIAKIEATKAGNALATSYLGGNCYKNLADVMQGHKDGLDNVLAGYAPQMIDECKGDAEIALKQLIEHKTEELEKLTTI